MEEESAGDGYDYPVSHEDAPRPVEEASPPLETDTAAYPPEGRLASALADHFGQGFDANFADTFADTFTDTFEEDRSEDLRDDLTASFAPDYSNDFRDEFDDFADDSDEAFDHAGGNLGGAFNRRLARQFAGEDDTDLDGYDLDDKDSLTSRPLGLRSLQWIRRNMTSLRIIVSLQRVTPPDISDHKPRKASGA